LLQLQLRIAQIDANTIGKLSAEKLKAMMTVLKERARDLERELAQAGQQIRAEFGLPWNAPIAAAALSGHLNVMEHSYRNDIKAMQADLARIADDRALRQWLKEQRQEPSDEDLADLVDLLDPAVFDFPAPPRRRSRRR
jgi:hypothetical protein